MAYEPTDKFKPIVREAITEAFSAVGVGVDEDGDFVLYDGGENDDPDDSKYANRSDFTARVVNECNARGLYFCAFVSDDGESSAGRRDDGDEVFLELSEEEAEEVASVLRHSANPTAAAVGHRLDMKVYAR